MKARIVIDGSNVVVGGGCTFVLHLVPMLARLVPESRFLVLVRNPRIADEVEDPENLEIRQLPRVGPAGLLSFLAFSGRSVADDWKPDLWFSVSECTPEGLRCPAVACFQNPNVWTELRLGWPWTQRLRLMLLRRLAFRSVGRCEKIAFLSEDSRAWMGRAIGLPIEQQALLPCGVTLDEWQPATPNSGRHILSVSSVYRYKNYVRLIEAYAELARSRPDVPDLRIVGKPADAPYAQKMREARSRTGDLATRIHLDEWVTDEQLRRHFAEAAMFVFPSYLETFGIPLIEAMASGLPLVAGDIPIFREVAEGVALFADPHSTSALTAAMAEALTDSEARRERIARGFERAGSYSWDAAARELLEVFETVLESTSESKKSVPPTERGV